MSASTGRSLHSRYDPVKEAIRFLDAQSFPCVPSIIVVTEPGESYIAHELKLRYPNAKIVAIRYQDDSFADSDALWDSVWRPSFGRTITSFLLEQIPDELLPLTVFIAWKPSDSAWPEVSQAVWHEIASLVRLQQSIMQTRAWFGKRWFSNMVWNSVAAERFIHSHEISKPILLAAAGPSLDRLYPFDRDGFYVLAVSAAVESLYHRGYAPDLCIATDGGFWACEHLRGLPNRVPVAFPLEAAIPSNVLADNPLLILDYGSLLERHMFSLMHITGAHAERNGTVAGTAAVLALSMTRANVYAAGLDLAPSTSFAHTRPYAADSRSFGKSDRFTPVSRILYEQNLATASLDAYASWFSTRSESFRDRFFRIEPVSRALDGIRTVEKESIATSVHDTGGMLEPIHASMPKETRVTVMRAWLDDCREKLQPFSAADHGSSDRFAALLDGDPLVAELVSTVAYGEFVRYLKQRGSLPVSEELAASVESVCAVTIEALTKNMARLERYG